MAEKIQLGKLEKDLVKKLDKYADLTNNARIGVLRNLINDFLDLEEYYYFGIANT